MRKAINNGDIIIVSNLEYIGDYDKRGYKPEFTRALRAWIVDDIGNNGTIHAHDKHGSGIYSRYKRRAGACGHSRRL